MPSLVQPVRTTLPHHQPLIKVEGGRLALRPWVHGDAAQLKAAFRDKQIQRWNLREFANIAEARQWVDHTVRLWRKHRGASWAIVEQRRRDIVLGQVGFRTLHLADGLAELSCWIMPKARRKHLGTEATRLLTAWAFDTLGMERLEIIHSVQNMASCPVALRAGFQIEGIKRHLQRHDDGFHDMCLHSRIRTDDGLPIPTRPPVEAVPDAALASRPPRISLTIGFRRVARGKSPGPVGIGAVDRS